MARFVHTSVLRRYRLRTYRPQNSAQCSARTDPPRPAYVISTNMVQAWVNRSPAMAMMAQRKRAGAISNPWVAFLLLAGDIQSNPGWKYPCNVCEKNGLQCEECDLWTHLKCLPAAIHMTTPEYNRISQTDKNWYCFNCQLPMFTDCFFSSTSSSDDNEIQPTEGFDTIRNKHPKDSFLAYLNINSFRHKVINIRDSLKVMLVDILAIAETKLDNSFRNARHHGGVLVYVHSDIPCRQIRELEMTHTESIAMVFKLNNSTKYWIVATVTILIVTL